ncbi:hypothetical protein EBZ39_17040 [bacterium]|jgi:hypothetical protein|nr:hypothetical protein [bacterium]
MTPINEFLLVWLKNMPELLLKSDLLKYFGQLGKLQKKQIIKAYDKGRENYIDPKKCNMTGKDYYDIYYGVRSRTITRRTLQNFYNVRKQPKKNNESN